MKTIIKLQLYNKCCGRGHGCLLKLYTVLTNLGFDIEILPTKQFALSLTNKEIYGINVNEIKKEPYIMIDNGIRPYLFKAKDYVNEISKMNIWTHPPAPFPPPVCPTDDAKPSNIIYGD